MIDTKEPGVWGAAAAAIVAGFYWLRHLTRRDKEDGAGSNLNVAMTEAAKGVIGLLQDQIEKLIKKVESLEGHIQNLINENHNCRNENQVLIGRVADLSKRVTIVEKDAKP